MFPPEIPFSQKANTQVFKSRSFFLAKSETEPAGSNNQIMTIDDSRLVIGLAPKRQDPNQTLACNRRGLSLNETNLAGKREARMTVVLPKPEAPSSLQRARCNACTLPAQACTDTLGVI